MHSKVLQRSNLKDLLSRTVLSPIEISQYEVWDPSVAYTRNRVATDNEHFELLVLCWNSGRSSPIHNHPGDGCYVKVLSGSVQETIYDIKGADIPVFRREAILNTGELFYIDDSLGIHRLGNPSKNHGAVTLHLYTPPVQSCKV
jgi:cysteine dioxygenase